MKRKNILYFIISFSLVISLMSGCNYFSDKEDGDTDGLLTYSDYDLIKARISSGLEKMGYYSPPSFRDDALAEDAGSNGASVRADSSSSDYSKTNIQVEGVDEADIVKTDGEYIYVIANNRLSIIDITSPEDMEIVSKINFNDSDSSIMPFEMFIDPDNMKLTLIGYSYEYRAYPEYEGSNGAETAILPEPGIDIYYRGFSYMQNVVVMVIDLSEIDDPVIEREFLQEGSYISSRKINEYIYIATNKYLYLDPDDPENENLIPAVRDKSIHSEWTLLPSDSIYIPEEGDYNSFIVLSSLNTIDTSGETVSKAVLGSGSNLYASANAFYLANPRYEVEEMEYNDSDSDIVARPEGEPDRDVADDSDDTADFRIFDPPVFEVFTDIYKFEINNGSITPAGSGYVPGYIINQFAMDEYEGYFRIATTTGDTWRDDEFTSLNNLYILDADLEIAGKIEGLAATETIRSVRFMGDKAYFVTFRTTDPLFVFDLSDPENPNVLGELKIPGYSQYLHPISDTILIGFGRDAIEENDFAIELGMKISVFDVSDLTDPKEISVMTIGGSGTYSEVLHNHKALLYSKEKNILGFPITIFESSQDNNRDFWRYEHVFSGFMIVGLDEDNQLFEKGRVSHFDFSSFEDSDNGIREFYYYGHLFNVRRGVYVDDVLFTVSDAYIKSASLDDYSKIGEIELPGFEEILKIYYQDRNGPAKPDYSDQDKDHQDEPDGNLRFKATIDEVYENSLLVTVRGDFHYFDIATVHFSDDLKMDFSPDEGLEVIIEILPEIRESYPVQVVAVNIILE